MARKAEKNTPTSEPETDNDLLIDDEPPTVNPYEILGIDEKATTEQVKSAYRKQALKHHPDKATPENKDAAHKKFQEIAFAYAILSNERRRRRYDLTGSTAETLLEEDDTEFNWTDFYREQYSSAIDSTVIEKFKQEYQGSEEERADVLAAYEAHEGDLDGVFEEVMLSNVLEDEERFRTMIQEAIERGEVAAYEKFSRESSKKRRRRIERAKGEEKEAMELARELGLEEKLFGNGKGKGKGRKNGSGEDGEAALTALIQQRQKSRAEAFFADLEAKYGPPAKRAKRKG
ncbi:hypothetical protein VTO42DRAFT_6668 [Malbranchea cinnamomea]